MKKPHVQSPCYVLGTMLITHHAITSFTPPNGVQIRLPEDLGTGKMTVHPLNYIQRKDNYTWQNKF